MNFTYIAEVLKILSIHVSPQEGRQARFDFHGNLVNQSQDIPEYLGLHHHGDDPSSAGYTLEELIVLARSSFLQQRVLALQVLARIITQVSVSLKFLSTSLIKQPPFCDTTSGLTSECGNSRSG